VSEQGNACGEQGEQQRSIRVLIQEIERRIMAGQNLIGVGDVGRVISQAETDKEPHPQHAGDEHDQREPDPPI
jgi:hypothetical protein